MEPLISVIVPVYNVEKYVLKCLNSLKGQNYSNLEIIIVDDGSTDGSGKICDDFVKTEPRARVFHKNNGGLSDARNFGINKAKGDLIAFVDSDDFVKKMYISKMLEAMTNDGADIVVCGYNNTRIKREILDGEKATARLLVRQENVDILAWNKLYRKDLFADNRIEFPKGQNHEDLLTVYKVMSKAKIVSFVDDALYCYVERKDSITNEEKEINKIEKREQAAREAIEYFAKNTELKKASEVSLLLAKYAYLDASLSGKVKEEYGALARRWINDHKRDFNNNKYITKRLRTYNVLVGGFGGVLYKLFRKIRHG